MMSYKDIAQLSGYTGRVYSLISSASPSSFVVFCLRPFVRLMLIFFDG